MRLLRGTYREWVVFDTQNVYPERSVIEGSLLIGGANVLSKPCQFVRQAFGASFAKEFIGGVSHALVDSIEAVFLIFRGAARPNAPKSVRLPPELER